MTALNLPALSVEVLPAEYKEFKVANVPTSWSARECIEQAFEVASDVTLGVLNAGRAMGAYFLAAQERLYTEHKKKDWPSLSNETGERSRQIARISKEWRALVATVGGKSAPRLKRPEEFASRMMQYVRDEPAAVARLEYTGRRGQEAREQARVVSGHQSQPAEKQRKEARPDQETRAVPMSDLLSQVQRIEARVRRISVEDRADALDVLRQCAAQLDVLLS